MTAATISDSQAIYAFGSNGSGQLGIGHREDTSTPEPVRETPSLNSTRTLKLACGGNHTIILSHCQHPLVAGNNEDGRCLGVAEGQDEQFTPSLFSRGSEKLQISHVAATWSATIAVCHANKVWVCGTGSSGELGLGESTSTADQPTQLLDFPPEGTFIVKLAACMGHVAAVLSNGEVWGWGKGRKGQLGELTENVWRPRKIPGIDFFVVDAVCGKDFTCVFGHPSTGQLLVLGPKGNDRFDIRKHSPESVHGWKQLGATWGSILVLFDSGHLIGWGRNDHGQLPPADLPPLESFAAGSEHCLGVTKAGNVLAWGWGEHGNCGLPTDTDGDVKGRWNVIATYEPATTVFAGCATSFVVAKAHAETLGQSIGMPQS